MLTKASDVARVAVLGGPDTADQSAFASDELGARYGHKPKGDNDE